MTTDVIVIGGGLAGLSTAALLANKGRKVLLLEKNQRLGGYATSYTSHGHRFDIATQALGGCGEGGVVHSILVELGIAEQIRFLACEPARMYYLPDGKTYIQHGFLRAQQEELKKAFPAFLREIDRCFAVWQNLFEELETIATKPGGEVAFQFARSFPNLARYSRTTVQQFFNELAIPQALQVRLACRAGYCMLPLHRLSLVAFACTEMSFASGAWMVEGGVSRLADVLRNYIVEQGGEVRARSRVTSLVSEHERLVGVEVSGEKISCKQVVLACDGSDLLRGLPGLSDKYLSRRGSFEKSGSYFISYYQVAKDAVHGLAPNIEVWPGQESKLAGKENVGVYYLLIPSLVDPGSAPEGYHSFCLSVPLAAGVSPAASERRRLRQQLEKEVEAQFPTLKGKLRFLFELAPEHLQLMTANPSGSAYGWAQTPEQAGIHRLSIKTAVENLYLAGHWTMPGGGIAAVMTSGRLCAQAVLEVEGK
ncbi:MAG: NAD(P)/FAD-dependent oxidoreductase [Thermodesulfobacteriota bacterium]